MTIEVKKENDDSFTISWDENSHTESILNDFTEEDFIKIITEYLEKIANETSAEKKETHQPFYE